MTPFFGTKKRPFNVKTTSLDESHWQPPKQIRLCRCLDRRDPQSEKIHTGPWCADSFEKRSVFENMVKICNTTFGDGTHWIEERES